MRSPLRSAPRRRAIGCFLAACLLISVAHAQETPADRPLVWSVSLHPSRASLRGLYVVDESVIWASGTGGTVLRSRNGGEIWDTVSPAGAADLDFRDVHALDEHVALVVSAGAPTRIYRTTDGGQSWNVVFEDSREEVFVNAFSFWAGGRGLAFGDPADGRLFLIRTSDGGQTWSEIPAEARPEAGAGEAGFAGSGTALCVVDEMVFIGLGGGPGDSGARLLRSPDEGQTWESIDSPLAAGEAAGIFSIAFANRDHGVAVGGNYTRPDAAGANAAWTSDGGAHWRASDPPPRGYRSCVAAWSAPAGFRFVCAGPRGTDWSFDGGKTWLPLDDEGFHAIAFSRNGRTGIATGADGKIGIWQHPPAPDQ